MRKTQRPLLPRRKLKPLIAFDVSLVQPRLEGLLVNVDRDLQRKLEKSGHAPNTNSTRQIILMLTMARITSNAYTGLCYLLVDQGAPRWRKNFALLLAPANRQLMDILCSIVYIRDDFAARTLDYERAAYRAFKEEYQSCQKTFRGHPEWKPYLIDQQTMLRHVAKTVGITLKEKRNLDLIVRWKQPFKLSKKPTKSQPFLKWVVKWLYNDTSAEAHISGAGLFFVAPFLLADLADEQTRHTIESRARLQYEARHLGRTLMTVLAILTEIDAQFKLNNHAAAAYIWRVLVDYLPEAKEMYQERYQSMLAQTP
jgi:hypothetical protein